MTANHPSLAEQLHTAFERLRTGLAANPPRLPQIPQPPKETSMTSPDQPTLADLETMIAESQTLGEAVRLALSAGAGVPQGSDQQQIADFLLDRIYEEADLARAREQQHDRDRLDRMDAFDMRRNALELAIMRNRVMVENVVSGQVPEPLDDARAFLVFLADMDPRTVQDRINRAAAAASEAGGQ